MKHPEQACWGADLAVDIGAADGLLHAAARLLRQQGLPHARYLHGQLPAGHHHDRLQAACQRRLALLRERFKLRLCPLQRQTQHRQHVRQRLRKAEPDFRPRDVCSSWPYVELLLRCAVKKACCSKKSGCCPESAAPCFSRPVTIERPKI